MLAPVSGFEDSALRSTRHELPWRAVRVPYRCINNFRIRWIENQIECSGRIAAEKNFLPGLSSIDRFEDAALGIRPEYVTERGHVNDVRIFRIDSHPPDLLAFRKSDVRPRLAGVSRLEDAVAMRNVTANRRLARSDVNDVGIRFTHRNRADRSAKIFVGDGRPGHSSIGGLEDTATRGSEVVLHWASGRARDCNRSSAAKRSDLALANSGKCARNIGLTRLCDYAGR